LLISILLFQYMSGVSLISSICFPFLCISPEV
jgi:hypothetical protein